MQAATFLLEISSKELKTTTLFVVRGAFLRKNGNIVPCAACVRYVIGEHPASLHDAESGAVSTSHVHHRPFWTFAWPAGRRQKNKLALRVYTRIRSAERSRSFRSLACRAMPTSATYTSSTPDIQHESKNTLFRVLYAVYASNGKPDKSPLACLDSSTHNPTCKYTPCQSVGVG